jgi:hypothetical protein
MDTQCAGGQQQNRQQIRRGGNRLHALPARLSCSQHTIMCSVLRAADMVVHVRACQLPVACADTLHRFCKKEHDWGWKKFMELSKVMDGFTVDDTLVIKAQVQVIM